MKIGIIGATGTAGRALHAEAVSRGHETVALVRSAERAAEILGGAATAREVDAFDLTEKDLTGFDVIVDAAGFAPSEAHRHTDLARHLVETSDGPRPRLVFILGAGSLVTGEDRHQVIEDLEKMPGAEQFIAIPRAQLHELEYLQGIHGPSWVGVSPSLVFEPGPATTPVLGGDELLVDENGESRTSSGTIAVAILDEIEEPQHRNTRFTVRDGAPRA